MDVNFCDYIFKSSFDVAWHNYKSLYCKNMNLSYLNKTYVQNKLNNLRALVTYAVNILLVSEIE